MIKTSNKKIYKFFKLKRADFENFTKWIIAIIVGFMFFYLIIKVLYGFRPK